MEPMATEQFESLVADALDRIPEELAAAMDNVAVVVDDLSPPGGLFGLYEGIPMTRRGNNYTASAPDRITIFKATICGRCRNPEEVAELVHTTVIHEVAHHFGIDDKRLEELGWA
jgi:predicted Zn-dependent protease with MMP-like domain